MRYYPEPEHPDYYQDWDDSAAPDDADDPICEACGEHFDEEDLIRVAETEAYCKPCDAKYTVEEGEAA